MFLPGNIFIYVILKAYQYINYIISKVAYGIIPVVYKEEYEIDKQRMNK